MQTSLKLQTLPFSSQRTYALAALFIIGNILLPQLVHLIPGGGAMWLPIYFFTLVGAYKYGLRVGLLTAVFSPLLNSLLFSMPAPEMLPLIMTKSVLLATFAGFAARRFRKASLLLLFAVVIGYQILGAIAEWGFSGNFMTACNDFTTAVPGMLVQIVAGWLVINKLIRN